MKPASAVGGFRCAAACTLALAVGSADAQSVSAGSGMCNLYEDAISVRFDDASVLPANGGYQAAAFSNTATLTGVVPFQQCSKAIDDTGTTPASAVQTPLAAVPETSAWAMLLAGLAVLAVPRGRNKKSDTFS